MKMLLFIFCILFLILSESTLLSQDQDKDLIAYWSFDDSTAADNSGNGYHGFKVNNPIPDVGYKGACFRFKGKNSYIEENQNKNLIGDHIIIPRIPLEDYPEFTISMWVNEERLEFVGGSGYIFFGEVFNAWAGIYHAGHYPDPTLWVKFSTGSINDVEEPIKFDYKTEFNNKWMHYALVYKNGIMTAYINGKPFKKKVQPVNIFGSRAGIATNWWYYESEHRQSAAFTGRIDEVKIYKRALTDEELSLDSLPCKTWFDYNNFQKSDGIKFAGNATKNDSAIRLTKNKVGDVGAIWYQSKLPLNNNFSTEFSFKFTEGSNFDSDDGSLPGADGIVFVIQNQGNYAVGANGGDIGYSGINNAVAIEYDTYYNGPQQIENYFDPNGNHIALIKSENGIISSKHNLSNTLSLNDKIIQLENNVIYYSKIEYIYSDKRLIVYLDKELPLYTIVLDYAPIDLSDLIQSDDNQGYLGFTSGTGSAFENHYILNWKYCSDAPTVTNVNENYQEIKTDVLIYPNPTSDVLNIWSITKSLTNSKIQIFNFYGQDVTNICFTSSLNTQNLAVNIANLPSGIYLLRLIGDINKNISFIKN